MAKRGRPRRILITGASSGLGAALAEAYAEPDVFLALTGRNRPRLEHVAEACRRAGANVRTECLDVRDAEAMSAWIRSVDEDFPVDLVIANAGITGGTSRSRPIESTEAVRRVLATNISGVINTVEPILDPMRRRRSGQIAIVSSLAGLRGLSYSPAYSAAKAAIRVYGEGIHSALRREGVSVSVVLPGFVATPLDDSIDSPKPLRLTATRAAHVIVRGLRRRKPRIAFPFPLYVGALALSMMPQRLGDMILGRFPVAVPEPDAVVRVNGDVRSDRPRSSE